MGEARGPESAKTSQSAEETRLLDDEELAGIVGGTGGSSNDDLNLDGDDDPSTDSNEQGDSAVFHSPGPWD